MAARLFIAESAYVLSENRSGEWIELARLPAGARALLEAAAPMDEARLEKAIEIAEDWLMPHAGRLRGELLELEDATGRLQSGLADIFSMTSRQWSIEDVESIFLRLVDMATSRTQSLALQERELFVADVLMLRELAHHGRVGAIRLT